ncbi:unnamed protein product [Lepidochelys kempii]
MCGGDRQGERFLHSPGTSGSSVALRRQVLQSLTGFGGISAAGTSFFASKIYFLPPNVPGAELCAVVVLRTSTIGLVESRPGGTLRSPTGGW